MAMLVPQGDARYKESIHVLEREIRKNPVGAIVLDKLKRNVLILPVETRTKDRAKWTRAETDEFNKSGKVPYQSAAMCNAITSPDDDADGRAKLTPGTNGGKFARDKAYSCTREDDEVPAILNITPTARGTGTTIYFTPSDVCTGFNGPELLFFHELCHAVRRSHGVVSCVPTANEDYTNEEEFMAITVTNVYVSANPKKFGSQALRYGHGHNQPLAKEESTSKGFVDVVGYRWLLSQHADWDVAKELAKLRGFKFNPFEEYVARQDAARKAPARK